MLDVVNKFCHIPTAVAVPSLNYAENGKTIEVFIIGDPRTAGPNINSCDREEASLPATVEATLNQRPKTDPELVDAMRIAMAKHGRYHHVRVPASFAFVCIPARKGIVLDQTEVVAKYERDSTRAFWTGADDAFCDVCFQKLSNNDDRVILCDGDSCSIGRHRKCYGKTLTDRDVKLMTHRCADHETQQQGADASAAEAVVTYIDKRAQDIARTVERRKISALRLAQMNEQGIPPAFNYSLFARETVLDSHNADYSSHESLSALREHIIFGYLDQLDKDRCPGKALCTYEHHWCYCKIGDGTKPPVQRNNDLELAHEEQWFHIALLAASHLNDDLDEVDRLALIDYHSSFPDEDKPSEYSSDAALTMMALSDEEMQPADLADDDDAMVEDEDYADDVVNATIQSLLPPSIAVSSSSSTSSASSSSSSPSASSEWDRIGVRILPSTAASHPQMQFDMEHVASLAMQTASTIWTVNELTPNKRGLTTPLHQIITQTKGKMGRTQMFRRMDQYMRMQACVATGMSMDQMKKYRIVDRYFMRYESKSKQQAPHTDHEQNDRYAPNDITGTYHITLAHGTFFPNRDRLHMQATGSSNDASNFSSQIMQPGSSSWARADTPHFGPQHNPSSDSKMPSTRCIVWFLLSLDASNNHTHDIAEGTSSRGITASALFEEDALGQPIQAPSSPMRRSRNSTTSVLSPDSLKYAAASAQFAAEQPIESSSPAIKKMKVAASSTATPLSPQSLLFAKASLDFAVGSYETTPRTNSKVRRRIEVGQESSTLSKPPINSLSDSVDESNTSRSD